MSPRRIDILTGDLFAVPQAAAADPGSMDYRSTVSIILGDMLQACGRDRHDVAAAASKLTGKDVSKHMLDGYTAESREDFNVPLYLAPALEVACGSYELSGWLAKVRGARLVIGADALNAELGRLERLRDSTGEQIKVLKERLRRDA